MNASIMQLMIIHMYHIFEEIVVKQKKIFFMRYLHHFSFRGILAKTGPHLMSVSVILNGWISNICLLSSMILDLFSAGIKKCKLFLLSI